MIIKRKSLIVGLVSSIIVALVLVMTLIGYFVYLEFKNGELASVYEELLGRAKARVYSRYLEVFALDARIENTGALKGKPIIEGAITNKGSRQVIDLIMKISFLDRDSASIYEFMVHPQEPALSGLGFNRGSIDRLYNYPQPKDALKPGQTLKFKHVITGCPTEIFLELREGEKPTKSFGRWSGKVKSDTVSLDLI